MPLDLKTNCLPSELDINAKETIMSRITGYLIDLLTQIDDQDFNSLVFVTKVYCNLVKAFGDIVPEYVTKWLKDELDQS